MCLIICCYSRITTEVWIGGVSYCADGHFLKSGPGIIDYMRNPKTKIPIPDVANVFDRVSYERVGLFSRRIISLLFSLFPNAATLYLADIPS